MHVAVLMKTSATVPCQQTYMFSGSFSVKTARLCHSHTGSHLQLEHSLSPPERERGERERASERERGGERGREGGKEGGREGGREGGGERERERERDRDRDTEREREREGGEGGGGGGG